MENHLARAVHDLSVVLGRDPTPDETQAVAIWMGGGAPADLPGLVACLAAACGWARRVVLEHEAVVAASRAIGYNVPNEDHDGPCVGTPLSGFRGLDRLLPVARRLLNEAAGVAEPPEAAIEPDAGDRPGPVP